MMHDRFESLVDLLLAGGLDPAERREAEAHASSCAGCGALLLEARSFHAWATGAIRPDAPPADLEDRLVARFRAANAVKPRRSWPRLGRALKVVGGVAAIGLFIILGSAFTSDAPLIDQLVQAAKSYELDNAVYPTGSINGSRMGLGATSWAVEGKRKLSRLDGKIVDAVSDGIALHSELRSLSKQLDEGLEGHGEFLRGKRREYTSGEELSKLQDLANAEAADALALEALGAVATPNKPEPTPAPKTVEKLADRIEKVGEEKPAEPIPFQAGRKLIRNADVSVEVEAYDAALAKINAVVAEEKGFVASADTERMANGKISATVTLRIPPERFEAVIERFRALGTVRHQSISSQDVTKAYVDLESRLGSKQALLERLKKVLAEAKGTVKELMEVEVQMGKTLEELEAIKGELKYLDNQVGLSTIILRLAEKDLGQPFEVVQTLQAAIGITSPDTEAVYVRAQKVVTDAGGQVVDSNLVRSKDGSARGTIKAKVDAEKFPALREELRKLGHVDVDTVVDRKTARGGQEGTAKPDAPVRKEQAVITLSIATPPIHVSRTAQLAVETADVEGAYLAARKAVEAAGGKVLGGSLTGRTDGMSASLTVQVETGKFAAVLDGFRGLGKVLHTTSSQAVPPAEGALVSERGQIDLALSSPPQLIGEQHGIVRTIRETLAGSWAGLLWSIEKFFVGISLAGPWLALALGAWLVWRRIRRKKAAQTSA